MGREDEEERKVVEAVRIAGEKVSRWKEASRGGETETMHIHGAERADITSGTLEDRTNVKVRGYLRVGCAFGWARDTRV